MKNKGVVLDTCALIWLMGQGKMSRESLQKIRACSELNNVFINPMSAWEIGTLVSKNRISLSLPVDTWFMNALAAPGFNLLPLDVPTLIQSTALPGSPPNDPVDRIMLATARVKNLTLVTRDKLILNYCAKGYASGLAC